MAVVIDTDVVSFLYRGDTRSALYESHLDGEFMILSFMTLAELRLWTIKNNWGARKISHFDAYLRRYSINYPTAKLCQAWAEVKDGGRRTGKNIDVADAWIAATALYFDVPLITHNAEDFRHVSGLNVISEQ